MAVAAEEAGADGALAIEHPGVVRRAVRQPCEVIGAGDAEGRCIEREDRWPVARLERSCQRVSGQ